MPNDYDDDNGREYDQRYYDGRDYGDNYNGYSTPNPFGIPGMNSGEYSSGGRAQGQQRPPQRRPGGPQQRPPVGPPGQGPGGGQMPPGPPPSSQPRRGVGQPRRGMGQPRRGIGQPGFGIYPQPDQPSLYVVDPGAIRGCLYKFTFIWLENGRSFWAWLTFVGRNSVAGYRWTGYRWVYFGTDLNNISDFECY